MSGGECGLSRFARAVGGSNGAPCSFGQNPEAVLLGGVAHIVRARAEKQVRRLDAPRVVAVMANVQAVRNRAIRLLVGRAVCRDRPAAATAQANVAVAEGALRPGEAQTLADALGSAPQPVCERAFPFAARRPEREVVHIAAAEVFTQVADPSARGDWAVGKLPCDAMREQPITTSACIDPPVSILVQRPRVEQAIARCGEPFGKRICERRFRRRVHCRIVVRW